MVIFYFEGVFAAYTLDELSIILQTNLPATMINKTNNIFVVNGKLFIRLC